MNWSMKIFFLKENYFPTEFRKIFNCLKTEREMCEAAQRYHTHIYLSNKSLQIQINSSNTGQLTNKIGCDG